MRTLITCVPLLLALSWLAPAGAQGRVYTFTVSGLVGLGGSVDESDAGFGNPNWQLGFSNTIEDRTRFGLRIGGLDWGSDDQLGNLTDPSLLYVTLAGEYRESGGSFTGSFIEPGIYIGLGLYQLDGTRPDGGDETDESVGLVVGVTGDLPLNSKRDWVLRLEFSGHYADLDAAQLFGIVELGVAYKF